MKQYNKRIVKKLAWSSFRTGKHYVSILSIALAALMFTSVFTIVGSLLDSMKDNQMRISGSYAHGGFHQMSMPEYERVAADPALKDIAYSILIGDASGDAFKELPTEIRYAQDNYAKWSYSYPQEGRMPSEKNEIAISSLVLDRLGLTRELGQQVNLTFKTDKTMINEEFTLVGIWEGNPLAWRQNVWVAKEYSDAVAPPAMELWNNRADVYSGYMDSQFWFKASWNLEQQAEKMASRHSFDGQITTNSSAEMLSIDSQIMLLTILIILIILLAGYLIIFNVFYISIAQDIQSYGLLKMLGSTKRQIRAIVRYKALLLSSVGIPLGLILGWAVGRMLVPFIVRIWGEDVRTVISIHPYIFVAGALFSLMTVYLSCSGPAKTAASVSPVEAVKFNEVQRFKPSTPRRSARSISPLRLALANLSRSRRKLVMVTLSFALSLLLLNTTYNFVSSFSFDKFIAFQTVADFTVADASIIHNSPPFNTSGISPSFIEQVQRLDGLENSGSIYVLPLVQHLSAQAVSRLEAIAELMEEEQRDDFKSSQEMVKKSSMVNIFGLSEWPAQMIQLWEGSLDQQRWKNGEGIYVTYSTKLLDGQHSLYEPGDQIKVEWEDGTTKEYEVLAIVSFPKAIHSASYYNIGLEYVLPSGELLAHSNSLQPMYSIFNIDDQYLNSTEQWLQTYTATTEQSIDYFSKNTSRGTFQNLIFMYEVIGGALCVLLAIIGLVNFMNSMLSTILLRRRELAVLQSIAMTDRQVKRMLIYEGMSYAVLALLISILLSYIVGVTIVPSLGAEMEFFTPAFSLLPVATSLVPLVLIATLVPLLCFRSVSKQSIIERLRTWD